jgi:hypothetical protein
MTAGAEPDPLGAVREVRLARIVFASEVAGGD